MADYDGDLTNVNPDLLKLCANAEDWREQRRRAMKAKIFGSGGDGQPNPNAYLTSDGTAGPSPSSAPAPSPGQLPASQQASESYILQQILSHKRRRDEANQQSASCGSPATQPTAQQQYQNHQQHQHQQQHYQQQEQHQRYQQQQHQQQPPIQSEGELSLKEKLMRKYSKK